MYTYDLYIYDLTIKNLLRPYCYFIIIILEVQRLVLWVPFYIILYIKIKQYNADEYYTANIERQPAGHCVLSIIPTVYVYIHTYT